MWINIIDFQDTIKLCSLIILKNNSIKSYGIIACPREKKMRENEGTGIKEGQFIFIT